MVLSGFRIFRDNQLVVRRTKSSAGVDAEFRVQLVAVVAVVDDLPVSAIEYASRYILSPDTPSLEK